MKSARIFSSEATLILFRVVGKGSPPASSRAASSKKERRLVDCVFGARKSRERRLVDGAVQEKAGEEAACKWMLNLVSVKSTKEEDQKPKSTKET